MGVFGFNSNGFPLFVTASGLTVLPVFGSVKGGSDFQPFFFTFSANSLCAFFPFEIAFDGVTRTFKSLLYSLFSRLRNCLFNSLIDNCSP